MVLLHLASTTARFSSWAPGTTHFTGNPCAYYQITCDNGECVHQSNRYNYENDCGDYSDEGGCGTYVRII